MKNQLFRISDIWLPIATGTISSLSVDANPKTIIIASVKTLAHRNVPGFHRFISCKITIKDGIHFCLGCIHQE